jgi:ABC-2 type transport system permease protein
VGETLSLYRRMLGARIRSDLQYRASFALFTVGQFFVTFVDFLVILVIFGTVGQLDGWTVEEVAFLYGTSGTAFNLADATVSTVEYIPRRIRLGTFDQFLIRPLGTLPQIWVEEFSLRRLGKLAQAVIVLVFALGAVDVDWTVGRALMVPVMVLSGAVIIGSIWVATSSVTFWIIDSAEVANSFTYGGNFMTQYPLGIYGEWFRRVFAIVVPLPFVNYFPALYVLGKEDSVGAPDFVRFLSPVVAALTIAVARVAWRSGLRQYRSTGS